MPRKKIVPAGEPEQNAGPETLGLPKAVETTEGMGEPMEGPPENAGGGVEVPLPEGAEPPPKETGRGEDAEGVLPSGEGPAVLPEDGGAGSETPGEPPPGEAMPNTVAPQDLPGSLESLGGEGRADVSPNELPAPLGLPPMPEDTAGGSTEQHAEEAVSAGGVPPEPPAPARTKSPKSDRQNFYGLNFNELDRDLTTEERQEWNSIYASYRGRSALSGTIIGVDPLTISVRNGQTGNMERQTMYCAIVIPYRVRVVIPAAEMWEAGHERPDFVLQNMVGATIDFIITKVDRESSFAIGSRRLAARSQRYFFAHRDSLRREGAKLKCRILSVGPRRCLVECYGHDINMTQRDLRYTAIPDLRDEYHPGQELDCVVKGYDAEKESLRISVKETESNPFEGAELRHPAGSRRQAVIAGKYGGGVFCNLPDGTVCMCNYSYQHTDADFQVGDSVVLVVQRHELEKRQMYGKILTKW